MNIEAKKVAVVGSGPAGLMAAHVISGAGHDVTVFEKKPGPGRKFLIAGSSGLNVTFHAPPEKFHEFYPLHKEKLKRVLSAFSPQSWIEFIHALGIKTFKGTSNRYFVEGLKASTLLRAWLLNLQQKGVQFVYGRECTDFQLDSKSKKVRLTFFDKQTVEVDVVCFCLGGASYEKKENPLRWPSFFKGKDLDFETFTASNVGYKVHWPEKLIKEVEGQPLKNVVFKTSRGSKMGDLMITKYGLEGTPVYFYGETGEATLDLKPDMSSDQILKKLLSSKENLSPLRRIKKYLNLNPVTLAFIFHMTPAEDMKDLSAMVNRLKSFPLQLREPQPLEEAISSKGGLSWEELTESMMLKKYPGVFAAGEMVDWDAPTGGFLIQACVSQGYTAGQGVVEHLKKL